MNCNLEPSSPDPYNVLGELEHKHASLIVKGMLVVTQVKCSEKATGVQRRKGLHSAGGRGDDGKKKMGLIIEKLEDNSIFGSMFSNISNNEYQKYLMVSQEHSYE